MLAPDGIASGLAQVGLFMGDKNAPDEFGIVFQEAIDIWQEKVTKENGGIFGYSPYEEMERSCGVTLFADEVFEKNLLEVCAVNEALESCGLKQNAVKLVVLPNLRRTVENRRFSPSQQQYQIKASHRFLGIVYPAMLSMGTENDQRIWATNRAWKELYGMWWDTTNEHCSVAQCAEHLSRTSLRFFSTTVISFVCRDAWRKSSALSCSARLHGKDRTT